MDWRSERKNFKWRRGLQIEFAEVESMNGGAPIGLHGVEQEHIPAWSRTVQDPFSPDHWRASQPHKILELLGPIYLSAYLSTV